MCQTENWNFHKAVCEFNSKILLNCVNLPIDTLATGHMLAAFDAWYQVIHYSAYNLDWISNFGCRLTQSIWGILQSKEQVLMRWFGWHWSWM